MIGGAIGDERHLLSQSSGGPIEEGGEAGTDEAGPSSIRGGGGSRGSIFGGKKHSIGQKIVGGGLSISPRTMVRIRKGIREVFSRNLSLIGNFPLNISFYHKY